MSKVIKWALIIVGALIVIGFVGFNILKKQTKKHSPEAVEVIAINDTEVEVKYCRPFKKDREIFGGLVPYGEVWRTGANEATRFKTNQDLTINGKTLKAGEYTLWTIPNKDQWDIIWSKKLYDWGVDFSAKAAREPKHDALKVSVPTEELPQTVEQFTIKFSDDLTMHLMWDKTRVSVPLASS
ncbi:DUF2911 domain-containing protein [Luteibaculum oceani]|uniref:DUF2911 domain-containing protein n=1 Tax=Luteibaculum oceani TaxID=1294296 RepID=A0A5C6V9F5_9FLAO|nr:DUF2911 domain-containing protein [Luteibaculum oceani]TXC82112.1 DUF2911 domain-containing protein [Luteibaculum oceani]